MVAVNPTFHHDYSTIVYGQYCDTFQDLYEISLFNYLFYVLILIDFDELHCLIHISRGFLSIDYFIEKYFADHSEVFLVCALITLLINLTVYNFISITIFPQISFNDQSAFPNLKSILSFNKDIEVGCILLRLCLYQYIAFT